MQKIMKNLGLYLILIVLVVSLVNTMMTSEQASKNNEELSYSELVAQIDGQKVKDLTLDSTVAKGTLKDGSKFNSLIVGQEALAERAASRGADVKVALPPQPSWWISILSSLLPTLLLVGVWIFLIHNMQGGGGRVMSFAKNKAKLFIDNRPKVGFDDVAGADEAKEELKEVVDFLKDSERFTRLGAKVPRGVLLLGAPGTGKTLLARACAGEADVPFFSTTGSDFVEMFVGVGASRVRDLFEQARKNQPCIVFIDEIDAVGRQRGAGLGGGHDEREQTLNQLLVEMDGFDDKGGIILIAATNRADVLDPALLRPGRFDRHIVVDAPDVKGREAILKVHLKGKKLAEDVNIETLAKRTPGFVGADLANLVNEAALLASRAGREDITMKEFEEGVDRAIAGTERRSRLISEKERKIIAYHEVGHALVAHYLPGCDPVHKISIVPRGSAALGYTLQLPQEDRFLASRNELINNICVLLGGRVAEDIVFGDVTTGASNDLQRVTKIARDMVMQYGMSDLGPVILGRTRHEVFLGRDLGEERNYSEEKALEIDHEVRAIVDRAWKKVYEILTEHRSDLDLVATALLEREKIDSDEMLRLLGETVNSDEETPVTAGQPANKIESAETVQVPNEGEIADSSSETSDKNETTTQDHSSNV